MKLTTLTTALFLLFLIAVAPAEAGKGGNGGGGGSPPPACNDGIDNDGDGRTDYPADSGCASINDTDEYSGPPPCVTVLYRCVYQCTLGDTTCATVAETRRCVPFGWESICVIG